MLRVLVAMLASFHAAAFAQVPPTPSERAAYVALFAAADKGDAAAIAQFAARGSDVNARDAHGRTPLHVAAYAGRHDAMRALASAGADPNAFENDRYDMVT